MSESEESLISVDFEVFGRVQGVFFRKFATEAATARQVVGWVENTRNGTVHGVIQGTLKNVEDMKRWLSEEGSPKSQIEKCVFSEEKAIESLEFAKFAIRHGHSLSTVSTSTPSSRKNSAVGGPSEHSSRPRSHWITKLSEVFQRIPLCHLSFKTIIQVAEMVLNNRHHLSFKTIQVAKALAT